MSDRELLEKAAKAAGLNYEHAFGGYSTDPEFNEFVAWNPLTDDGDALRLAVKLKLQIDVCGGGDAHVAAGYGCTNGHSLQRVNECVERVDADACAATRRAIVRAAAAIGGATA